MKTKILSAVAIMAILASSANAGNPSGLLDESFEREVEEVPIFEEDDDEAPWWILLGLIAVAALAAGGSGGGS